MSTALQLANESELVEASDPIVEAASQLMVNDQPSLELAGHLLTERIKPTLKEIDASCGPVVAAAHAAHKAATAQRNDLKKPLLEAEKLLKGKIGTYLDEQEQLRRAEQARIDREQREAQLALEKKALAEAEEQRLDDAAVLEAAGDTVAANALLDAPLVVDVTEVLPPAAVAPAPAKVAGISSSRRWNCEVVDLMALVRAVAEGKAPLSYLQVDMSHLVGVIRQMDGQVEYPGVRVFQDRITSARAS